MQKHLSVQRCFGLQAWFIIHASPWDDWMKCINFKFAQSTSNLWEIIYSKHFFLQANWRLKSSYLHSLLMIDLAASLK